MPDITEKLKLEIPLGNETFNREAYKRNINLMEQNAAAQSQVDEPFNLINAVYDATGNKIDITFGPGRVTFMDTLVAKTNVSNYSIPAPQANSNYYVYIKTDGNFMHNTTAGAVSGAALIWKVATGSPVSYINKEDRRGRMSGTDVQALLDYVNARLAASDPLGVAKPCFRPDLPPFHLWCDGKTIGDAASGATARANADVHDLFVVLWLTTSLLIYESTGAASGRGATAEADWAANKRLALPKGNGRTFIGLDNMGGTSANMVTDAQADILGGVGGEEKHQLATNELPSFRPAPEAGTSNSVITWRQGADGNLYAPPQSGGNLIGSNLAIIGGDAKHNNMPPWIACNWIMRY